MATTDRASMPTARDDDAALIRALTRENAALRGWLAAAEGQFVPVAVEAGELHEQIDLLLAELAEMRVGRDGWRAEAERLVGWSSQAA